jgi:diaminohydroxyphosphoribosylaminopyrimidine deaminase/5-amino-6-(5-phosphoribosylamino)uracil reductase
LRHLLHELAALGVGRVLVEGGGDLARAFLDQGLADEFHRFQAEAPAGGAPVRLDLSAAWRLQASADWPGGRWEIWREG